jgi:hypothetical protein
MFAANGLDGSVMEPHSGQLVETAYAELLQRVAAGEITKEDPVEVLMGLDVAWRESATNTHLAALLLDYAREQAAEHGTSSERDGVRRQRLFAVTQQTYQRMRVAMHPLGCKSRSVA